MAVLYSAADTLEIPMALAAIVERMPLKDPLLTAEEVAARLNVTKDWVWDHSSRKTPYLPVIRIGDGTLRYRSSQIEEFVIERERLSILRRKRR
jgi:predicted DNA-binding transcriptional regulator AlpA